MAKLKNLSPKFKIPVAEKELKLLMGQIPMGSQQGGLSLFSNKFKRGYGDAVFGSDVNGIWLGAAEWAGAPFRVDMQGNVVASAATFGQYATTAAALLKAGSSQTLTGDIQVGTGNVKIDGANKRILINDGSDDRILIGYQLNGF